jgi:hypothetical protein
VCNRGAGQPVRPPALCWDEKPARRAFGGAKPAPVVGRVAAAPLFRRCQPSLRSLRAPAGGRRTPRRKRGMLLRRA